MSAYRDRKEAGEKLASLLLSYKEKKDTLILGLPRGGVVVAAAVADLLHLPLDVIVPRKLSAPNNSELAIGAIAGEEVLLHNDVIRELQVSSSYLEEEIQKQREEARRRVDLFRKGRKKLECKNKTILLIDDGIATGATMEASILFLKKQRVKKIVVAIPVAPRETSLKIQKSVDALICPLIVENFFSVSDFYDFFDQTSDAEVVGILHQRSLP